MTALDPRRQQLLRRIGVDVWVRRDGPPSAAAPAPGTATAETAAEGTGETATRAPAAPAPAVPGQVADAGAAPATGADPVAALAAEIAACERCDLHRTRTCTVPGTGSATADWVFVGEAPGQNEDRQGLPFVGRAGQLLDAMLAALDMRRETVFIANVIKCRPPGNRDPEPGEVAACAPYLHRLLAILEPKVIVALGRVSAQALTGTEQSLGDLRGQVYRYGEGDVPLVVTYHPAYLLRQPAGKAAAWQDLLLARSVVRGAGG